MQNEIFSCYRFIFLFCFTDSHNLVGSIIIVGFFSVLFSAIAQHWRTVMLSLTQFLVLIVSDDELAYPLAKWSISLWIACESKVRISPFWNWLFVDRLFLKPDWLRLQKTLPLVNFMLHLMFQRDTLSTDPEMPKNHSTMFFKSPPQGTKKMAKIMVPSV